MERIYTITSLILMLCFINSSYAELSPVFLWGAQSEALPSLEPISGNDFAKVLDPLLKTKSFVVFLENYLSNEDFLCTNIADGKSCFAYLPDVSGKTYYAGVENPIEALITIAGHSSFISVDDAGNLSAPLNMGPGKINFLKFNDENQVADRESNLQLHDSTIASMTSQIGDNVVFMYTSASSGPSLKRQRRQTSNGGSGKVFRVSDHFLIYFQSISIDRGESTDKLEIKSMDVKLDNETAMSVTLTPATGTPLTFDIILAGGYYFMKNVMHDNIKFLSPDVYAPTDFSYFCGNLTLNSITSENGVFTTLKWNSLQFQAPFGHTKNTTFAFGDAWHCVGFFTGGILSGLLIVALLLTISFIGVCWMMDINTMDRFDDPKGKTITISASD